MSLLQRMDRDLMHSNNIKCVLMALLTSRKASKAELSSKTGISLMSVGRICEELMQLGLIRETEDPAPRSGGRPPKCLTMNDRQLLCCGVYVGKGFLQMGIIDAFGCVLEDAREDFPADKPYVPENVLPWMAEHLSVFLQRWRGKGLLANVGIALTGIVHEEKLEYSANLKWSNCDLSSFLKRALPDFDFFLENDTKALGEAEFQYGASAGAQNIVVLNMDDGVGSVAVLNGRVYRAGHNMAGEIGHVILNPNGKVCECGQVGCLQTYLARNVILNEAHIMYPGIGIRELFERAQRNEPFVAALANQVVDYTSVAINLLANMYAPEVILLSGSTIWESPVLCEMIEKDYRKRLNPYIRDTFALKFGSFGSNAFVVGGAAIAFRQVLETLQVRYV